MAKSPTIPKAHREAINEAMLACSKHTLLQGLPGGVAIAAPEASFVRDGYARIVVHQSRYPNWRPVGKAIREHSFSIQLNGFQRCDPEEWLNLIAQCKLHVALNHCALNAHDEALRLACEIEATELLRHLSIGRRPADLPWCDAPSLGRTVEKVAQALREGGAEAFELYGGQGVAGLGQPAWIFDEGIEPISDEIKK